LPDQIPAASKARQFVTKRSRIVAGFAARTFSRNCHRLASRKGPRLRRVGNLKRLERAATDVTRIAPTNRQSTANVGELAAHRFPSRRITGCETRVSIRRSATDREPRPKSKPERIAKRVRKTGRLMNSPASPEFHCRTRRGTSPLRTIRNGDLQTHRFEKTRNPCVIHAANAGSNFTGQIAHLQKQTVGAVGIGSTDRRNGGWTRCHRGRTWERWGLIDGESSTYAMCIGFRGRWYTARGRGECRDRSHLLNNSIRTAFLNGLL